MLRSFSVLGHVPGLPPKSTPICSLCEKRDRIYGGTCEMLFKNDLISYKHSCKHRPATFKMLSLTMVLSGGNDHYDWDNPM